MILWLVFTSAWIWSVSSSTASASWKVCRACLSEARESTCWPTASTGSAHSCTRFDRNSRNVNGYLSYRKIQNPMDARNIQANIQITST